VLWRAGLRIAEALALGESDLDPRRASVLVRRGKGGRVDAAGQAPPPAQRGRQWGCRDHALRTNTVGRPIAVGDGPAAIAIGGGGVWVANADDGSVSRIDPDTRRVTATIAVGHRPQGIAVAGGSVWVAVRA
jgi:YVTN family beta-propeller protein